MIDPIRILKDEHRLIERALDALAAFAGRIESNDDIDKRDLTRFATFITEYVDHYHHAKEEDILYDVMLEHGFSRDVGPLAVMFAEHDEGRVLAAAMHRAAEQGDAWSQQDRGKIAHEARAYVSLLRDHILKEDDVLYPMGEAHLPPHVLVDIAERYERFERTMQQNGEHARLTALADTLIKRFTPST